MNTEALIVGALEEPPPDPVRLWLQRPSYCRRLNDPAMMEPSASYNLLLAYQTNQISDHSSSGHGIIMTTVPPTPQVMSEYSHHANAAPEWHELVDRSLLDSLGRDEVKRQGLWWELIRLERGYVRDLQVICEVSGIVVGG